MIVRGAPAIGVSAAMGVAIGIDRSTATTYPAALTPKSPSSAKTLAETRPTAVNLFWGIDRRSATSTTSSPQRTAPSPRSNPPSSPKPAACTTKTSPPAKPWARTAHRCCPTKAPSSPTATPAPSPPAATAPRSASSAPPSSAATRSTSSPTRPAPSCRARASPPGS
jgi:hypothetical protein